MPRQAPGRPRRVSPAVLKLSSLIRKTASITFRRELGLHANEWRALALIGDDGPLSQGTLCELMAQDKGQVSRVVASLVADDMVLRIANGRSVTLSLAAKGRAVYERLTVLSYRRNQQILSALKTAEVRTLFHCLDVMTRNAHQMLASESAIPMDMATPKKLPGSTRRTAPTKSPAAVKPAVATVRPPRRRA